MTTKDLGLDREPAGPAHSNRPHRSAIGWWPSALGLGLALLGSGDSGTSVTIASVVAVIALIFVGAAVTGRRSHAWFGFLLSIPVVISGRVTGFPAAPFLIMGVVAVVLIIVGWRRGTWARACNRMQLYALVGFGAIAVAGALTDGTLAALLIAGGLLAHAGWDVIHLVRDIMVGRRYAEFCAALDAGLALTILWGLF